MSNWKLENTAQNLSIRLDTRIDSNKLQKATNLSTYNLAYFVVSYFEKNDFDGNLRFDFYLKACIYYYFVHVLLEKLYEKLEEDEKKQNINDPNFIFTTQYRCIEDKLITSKNDTIRDFLQIGGTKKEDKQYYVCIAGTFPKHRICNTNFEREVKKYIQTNTVYFDIYDVNSNDVWYNIPAQEIYKKIKELF